MKDPLELARGEKVILHVERNLTLEWMMIGLAGVGLVVFSVEDPAYGWGIFFIGIVILAFIGGAITSHQYAITDRRLIRTGYLGRKDLPLRGATLERAPGAFGETLTVTNGGVRLKMRHVRDAAAIEKLVLPKMPQ